MNPVELGYLKDIRDGLQEMRSLMAEIRRLWHAGDEAQRARILEQVQTARRELDAMGQADPMVIMAQGPYASPNTRIHGPCVGCGATDFFPSLCSTGKPVCPKCDMGQKP